MYIANIAPNIIMDDNIRIKAKRNDVIYGRISANTKNVKLTQRVIKRCILFLNTISKSSVFLGGIKEIKTPEVAKANNVAWYHISKGNRPISEKVIPTIIPANIHRIIAITLMFLFKKFINE